jgi:uncharacterized protein YunC (DUF1805 family)
MDLRSVGSHLASGFYSTYDPVPQRVRFDSLHKHFVSAVRRLATFEILASVLSPWEIIMVRRDIEFGSVLALFLCLNFGCAPAAPEKPVAVKVPAAPVAKATEALNANDTIPSADPFWNGLERHEIPLAQTLLLVKGSKGIAACPYLNVEMFEKTGEACIIIPAARIDDMPDSKVSALTPKARELGIEIGMPGREALGKIR